MSKKNNKQTLEPNVFWCVESESGVILYQELTHDIYETKTKISEYLNYN